MIQGQDYETLATMLGTHDFPEALTKEYDIRAFMLHKVGGGSFGFLGLVDLCRYCGLAPGADPAKPIVWSALPSNVRVRVLVGTSGNTKDGDYRGTVSPGIAAVKLDGCNHVNEFPIRDIEVLSGSIDPEQEEAALAAEHVSAPDKPSPLAEHILAQEAEVRKLAADWTAVAPGTKVLVSAGEDQLDAEFQSVDHDHPGCLTVLIDGKPLVVDIDDVVLAAELEV